MRKSPRPWGPWPGPSLERIGGGGGVSATQVARSVLLGPRRLFQDAGSPDLIRIPPACTLGILNGPHVPREFLIGSRTVRALEGPQSLRCVLGHRLWWPLFLACSSALFLPCRYAATEDQSLGVVPVKDNRGFR